MTPVRPLGLVLALLLASCAGRTGLSGRDPAPDARAAAMGPYVAPSGTRAPERTEAAATQEVPGAATVRRGPIAEEPGDIWAVTRDWDKPRPPLRAPGAAAHRRAPGASSTRQSGQPPLQQESGDFWSGVR